MIELWLFVLALVIGLALATAVVEWRAGAARRDSKRRNKQQKRRRESTWK